MGAVKITPADRWFSMCVRTRADNRCERCGGMPSPGGLHCSHFHGRGKWSVRFDPENGTALCYGCHAYFGSHPVLHSQWQAENMGLYRFESLQERANDLTRARVARREAKAIAAHYRCQFNIMLEKRSQGETGRIEFEGYL